MKRRLIDAYGVYRFPDPGELSKEVIIRRCEDKLAENGETGRIYPELFSAWAKVVQTSAAKYRGSVQTNEKVTHYVTIRYVGNITSHFEVVIDGKVFRIRRIRDLNSVQRFLLLECEELGNATRRGKPF